MDAIGPAGALIVAASPELRIGHDTEVKYAPDPDLHYLTGYSEPEAVAVLVPANVESRFTMFVRPRDRSRELWTGRRGGVEAARDTFGANVAHPIAELKDRLPDLVGQADTLFVHFPSQRPEIDELITATLLASRRARPRTGTGPCALIDATHVLARMRVIKDATELCVMRDAARISMETFCDAARLIRPGVGEWEVEAAIEGGFRRRGASGPAFPTIVASGSNATVLHYVTNDRVLGAGELVLVDAGARKDMYCADITRTFPVSGRFEGAGREVYEIVLAAHDAAIAAVAPGVTVRDVHEVAHRTLVEGMKALGLVAAGAEGTGDEAERVSRWYPHRTSHWLGLDVHDVGDYVSDGRPRALEAGMVLTVEPGLYIDGDAEAAPAGLRGIGVRIEDDVLVTPAGHDVLTGALPVRCDEVVALMS